MAGAKRVTQTLLAALLGLAILAGVNVLARKVSVRWDSTSTKRYSLAPETVTALANLKQAVAAVAYYRPQEPGRDQLKDLFDLFGRESKFFSYEMVDPDRHPFRAKEQQVTQTSTVVLMSGEKQEKVLFPDEERLANALLKVSNPRQHKVYFVTGHGEVDPDGNDLESCAELKKTLVEKGAAVDKITLARNKEAPADADAMLILGPRRDFLKNELELLAAYVRSGGRLLVALAAERITNLDGWLEENLRIRRRKGFTLDPVSRLIVGDPMAPLVQDYGAHDITSEFTLMTLFPTCAALESMDKTPDMSLSVVPLGRSTEQSWLETDMEGLKKGTAEFDPKTDTHGPLWLSAAFRHTFKPAKAEGEPPAKPGRETRAVVVADQDWLTNKYVNISGNLDFARNSVNWLLEQEGLITVSKPEAPNQFLFLSAGQRHVLTWGPLAALPGAALLVALVVALRRRKAR